jgi:hypothetical protein
VDDPDHTHLLLIFSIKPWSPSVGKGYILSASVQLSHLKDYRIKDLILKEYVQPLKSILFIDM